MRRGDAIKSNWFEWACTADFPNDNAIKFGTVQADFAGELVALETFQETEE